MNSDANQYVMFMVGEQQHGLPLRAVERIVRAAAITPLPKAPPLILGVVNVEGRIIPVASLRRAFGLAERELSTSDQFIIARTPERTVALVVDAVLGVITREERQVVQAGEVLPVLEGAGAVSTGVEGIAILHNLERLLEPDTSSLLEAALDETRKQPTNEPGNHR